MYIVFTLQIPRLSTELFLLQKILLYYVLQHEMRHLQYNLINLPTEMNNKRINVGFPPLFNYPGEGIKKSVSYINKTRRKVSAPYC